MRELDGRRVLVTGASSGIGEALARAASDAGARVALLARRAERVEALAEQLPGSVALVADVNDQPTVRAEVERGAKALGGLDAVVNNAGIMLDGQPAETDPDTWRAMVDTNVLGLLTVTRAALPYLREAEGPSIVNVSSMAGRYVPLAGSGVYSATKHAVHALGDALRLELQVEGIRVTTFAPGFVSTELTVRWPEGRSLERWKENARKGLSAEQAAACVVHILSMPPEVTVIEYAVTATTQLPASVLRD
jgi:NADP-dependent 3-hydroxy acid dehydrogenase YdfG